MSKKRISKWGNSAGIRIPKEILSMTDFDINDEVYIKCVELTDGHQGILITSDRDANALSGDIKVYELLQQIKTKLDESPRES